MASRRVLPVGASCRALRRVGLRRGATQLGVEDVVAGKEHVPQPTAELSFPRRDVPFLMLVGAGCATFWRGAWEVMDHTVFPDDQAASCQVCVLLGYGGFVVLHELVPRLPAVVLASAAMRAGLAYIGAVSTVFAWRSTWLACDIATDALAPILWPPPPKAAPAARVLSDEEQRKRTCAIISGLVTHFAATALLARLGCLASTSAPPARSGLVADQVGKSPYLWDVALWLKRG